MKRTVCVTGCVVAIGALAAPAQALPSPFLVRDINTAPVIFSSAPRQLVSIGGRIFFVADTPSGPGLWRSDGSAVGTALVKRIDVVGNLVAAADTLFFVASDPATGAELWRSDGTAAGTALVRDINPGPAGAFDVDERINGLAAVGDVLLFAAYDGLHGALWRSDGTAAGTTVVKTIGASELTAVGGLLLFAGNDGLQGTELWSSDGTAAGTVLVYDVNPGPDGSYPTAFTAVDGTTFFRAYDAQHGAELWKTDGSTAGTTLVRDINPGNGGSYPENLAAVNRVLFFRAADDGVDSRQLWKSDGTEAGTVRVRHFDGVGYSGVGSLVGLDDMLLFVQDEGEHGLELWRSDGTASGTVLVKDINPGGTDSVPSTLTVVDGVLFFFADDGVHGAELWRTDGSASGTALVRDINPGPLPSASNYPAPLAALDGRLVFAADDALHGLELWISDGTSAGTDLVKDLWPGPNTADASPAALTVLGNALLFTADDGSGLRGLWRTDGTEAGTLRIAGITDINVATPPSLKPLTLLGGRVLVGADDRVSGNELWASDGTAAGTVLVSDIFPGPDSSRPAELTAVGDAVFFTAEDGAHGRALWKTDGTPAGTVLVRDFADDAEGTPEQLTASGGRLFFLIGNDRNAQLWVSDGTTSGTVQVRGAFFGSDLTDVDGMLYFTTATRLLKSDGTVEGTVVVGDFHPVSGQYTPRQLTAVGADLFFSAELGTDGVRLFVVGAHSGALRVLDKFKSNYLTSAAGRLFFVVGDATYGVELWTSDGTVAGTRLVRDVNPGTASSGPTGLSADGDRLLFRACDAERCALWTSDGSEAATRPLADLGSLGASSFVRLGALVFFTAANIEVGKELWAVSLSDGCAGDCDGDGVVTIDELIHLVALALGESGTAECAGAGRDDGEVSINDLVAAVDNALVGCGSAVPTPSMTPTATPTNPPGCCFCAPRTPAAQTASFTDCLHTPNCGWYDDPCHCGNFCP